MCRRIQRWLWMALVALGLGWLSGRPVQPAVPEGESGGGVRQCVGRPSIGGSQGILSNKKGDDEDGDSIGRQPK